MTRRTHIGLVALLCAAATIWLLPAASLGQGRELERLDNVLKGTTEQIAAALEQAVAPVSDAAAKTKAALDAKKRELAKARDRAARATAADPARQPPVHGSNPHGQGGVAVVDLSPSNERPLGANPNGSDSGPEEIVVGRARGEQTADGRYHGHITILGLLGNELAGVDTTEGQTKNGPLQPLQANVLDPLCTSTGQQVCLSVLTANSATAAGGSQNDFAIARAKLLNLGVGAAESASSISATADCQTAAGSAKTANVTATGGAVAQVANSTSGSESCRNQAPKTSRTSQVIALGGTGIPLPAAGCDNGTPDTVFEVPLVARIVCNADDVAGAAVVREALDVFALNSGATSLAKETTAAAEALSVAPSGPETGKPACSDGVDNDGDGVIDAADPGCHSDGNPNNPSSYNPGDTSEADSPTTGSGGETGPKECSDNRDNDGDKRIDEDDPGCHSDRNPNNPASYEPEDDDESNGPGANGGPQCSDNRDNDGDGVVDEADPGCHSDGNPSNPSSYNPNDDSEADNARPLNEGALPFTGANVVGLALAGLLLLAGGLLLRRREVARPGA